MVSVYISVSDIRFFYLDDSQVCLTNWPIEFFIAKDRYGSVGHCDERPLSGIGIQ